MVKTSVSHPLQIDCVTPPGTTGTIGMTLCPGRKGTSVAGGSWDRDLGLDLQVVRAWRPDIAIALLEDFEYGLLGIPHFRESVLAAGLPWVFLHIVDGGAPDAAFERAWLERGPSVRAILRRGGRVLLHCRAGLGRTGLLAATLLVELGSSPEVAIDLVRAARPGTVETAAQESYVRSARFDPS
jgi:hypothetical protein